MSAYLRQVQSASASRKPGSAKVICVSSGKGGVGKTLSVTYLATFAAKLGHKVLVIDGDFGMSNVDVVLGLNASYNIRDVFDGRASIKDILLTGPMGIKIVPSGSGLSKLQHLSFIQKQILLEDLKSLQEDFDLVILDSGAGIGTNVIYLNQLAHKTLVVTSPEPHAITDAYALIKTIKETTDINKVDLMVNMTKTAAEGQAVGLRIVNVAREYLQMDVNYVGCVPLDPMISRFVLKRSIASEESTKSMAAQAWSRVTRDVLENFHTNDEMNVRSFLSSVIHSTL